MKLLGANKKQTKRNTGTNIAQNPHLSNVAALSEHKKKAIKTSHKRIVTDVGHQANMRMCM